MTSSSGPQTASQPAKTPALTEALDKTPPHGMKGILPPAEALSPQTIFGVASVLLLAALTGALIMWVLAWWRLRARRKAREGLPLYNPSLWAELRAVISQIVIPGANDLNEPSQEEWNQFTSDVSLCLRRGLEIRTGYPLAESTTEEIMGMLVNGSIRLVVVSDHELRSTLQRLDEIRFGGRTLGRIEAAEILDSLKRWCDKLEVDDQQKTPSSHGFAPQVDEKGGLRVFNS